jgi:hypothetical protein
MIIKGEKKDDKCQLVPIDFLLVISIWPAALFSIFVGV